MCNTKTIFIKWKINSLATVIIKTRSLKIRSGFIQINTRNRSYLICKFLRLGGVYSCYINTNRNHHVVLDPWASFDCLTKISCVHVCFSIIVMKYGGVKYQADSGEWMLRYVACEHQGINRRLLCLENASYCSKVNTGASYWYICQLYMNCHWLHFCLCDSNIGGGWGWGGTL